VISLVRYEHFLHHFLCCAAVCDVLWVCAQAFHLLREFRSLCAAFSYVYFPGSGLRDAKSWMAADVLTVHIHTLSSRLRIQFSREDPVQKIRALCRDLNMVSSNQDVLLLLEIGSISQMIIEFLWTLSH
jgi:hypothetical protein